MFYVYFQLSAIWKNIDKGLSFKVGEYYIIIDILCMIHILKHTSCYNMNYLLSFFEKTSTTTPPASRTAPTIGDHLTG